MKRRSFLGAVLAGLTAVFLPKPKNAMGLGDSQPGNDQQRVAWGGDGDWSLWAERLACGFSGEHSMLMTLWVGGIWLRIKVENEQLDAFRAAIEKLQQAGNASAKLHLASIEFFYRTDPRVCGLLRLFSHALDFRFTEPKGDRVRLDKLLQTRLGAVLLGVWVTQHAVVSHSRRIEHPYADLSGSGEHQLPDASKRARLIEQIEYNLTIRVTARGDLGGCPPLG